MHTDTSVYMAGSSQTLFPPLLPHGRASGSGPICSGAHAYKDGPREEATETLAVIWIGNYEIWVPGARQQGKSWAQDGYVPLDQWPSLPQWEGSRQRTPESAGGSGKGFRFSGSFLG